MSRATTKRKPRTRYMVTDSCYWNSKAQDRSGRAPHWIEVVALSGPRKGQVKHLRSGSTIEIVKENR